MDFCATCGQSITLAADGAWEDHSGACGCGDDEHYPLRLRDLRAGFPSGGIEHARDSTAAGSYP